MMDRQLEIEAVKNLGEQIGYGNMMSIASALWAVNLTEKHDLPANGAFVPTVSILMKRKERKRAEEEQQRMMKQVKRVLDKEKNEIPLIIICDN